MRYSIQNSLLKFEFEAASEYENHRTKSPESHFDMIREIFHR